MIEEIGRREEVGILDLPFWKYMAVCTFAGVGVFTFIFSVAMLFSGGLVEVVSIEIATEAVCDSHGMVVESYDGLDEVVCVEKPVDSETRKVFRNLGDD